MHAIVKKIEPLPEYRLMALFDNGEQRIYDVTPWIKNKRAFAPLRDTRGLFERVRTDCGGMGIAWNDEIDLDADELWEHGSAPWVVKTVKVLDDYRLLLTFADGKRGIYDAKPLLERKIYAALKSPEFFSRVRVDGDSVIWNDDVDIAPELLYERSVPVRDAAP